MNMYFLPLLRFFILFLATSTIIESTTNVVATGQPSARPSTTRPSTKLTCIPSQKPTEQLAVKPPTTHPTIKPTYLPSPKPTGKPSVQPSTTRPTIKPTYLLSQKPTGQPSARPSTTLPTIKPTYLPSRKPTGKPSVQPSTTRPTIKPTYILSQKPTRQPSARPSTTRPSTKLTCIPSQKPTGQLAVKPPTTRPTIKPTQLPSPKPTGKPSARPSTTRPTIKPTYLLSQKPTGQPSARPSTTLPTIKPTYLLSPKPTGQPSARPSTTRPTIKPTYVPSPKPTGQPSAQPSSIPTLVANYTVRGNQIVDATGSAVRIAAVNWYGFDSSKYILQGLKVRSYTSIVDQIQSMGFNTIRVPFSGQMLSRTATPAAADVDYTLNSDLAGLTPLQCLDALVDYCGRVGLRIILTRKSCYADKQYSEYYWFVPNDPYFTQQQFITDWLMLAKRYNASTVLGVDLWDEPITPYATWNWVGPNTADWRVGAQTAGNAILALNPHWLIFVAGLGFDGWYGSDLRGAQSSPVVLTLPNQLVYSTRDLSQDSYIQPYFLDPSYPANLRDVWRPRWGYLQEQGIKPVFMGSFGTYFAYPVPDDQWLQTLVRYINGEFTQDNQSNLLPGQMGMSWAVGITGIGILNSDFQTANAMMPYLTELLAPNLLLLPTKSPSVAPSNPTRQPSTIRPTKTTPCPGPPPGPTAICVEGVGYVYALVLEGNVTVDDSNGFTMSGGSRIYFATKNVPLGGGNSDIYWIPNLLGKKFSFMVNISQVECGCNAAAYFTQMPGFDANGKAYLSTGNDYYCDANKVQGNFCPEYDLFEANKYAIQTALHTCTSNPNQPKNFITCDGGGCSTRAYGVSKTLFCPPTVGACTIDTTKPFKVTITQHQTNNVLDFVHLKMEQGTKVAEYNVCNNPYYRTSFQPSMDKMAFVASLWGGPGMMTWLDGETGCAETCNLGLSKVTFSDFALMSQ